MNAYEIHFEHMRVKLPDGTYPTFTLGITDHNIISCECCMYIKGLQGNHEVMSRVAYHLDEGLVEPWSALTLTYRTGRSRLWGRGSQDLGAVCCERPQGEKQINNILCTLKEEGELPNSEIVTIVHMFF